jgi:hypothetical protein
VSTNAASRQDGTLQWTPRLGQTLQLAAVTRSWDGPRIRAFAVGGGVLVVAALGLLGVLVYRWRRKRRSRRRQAAGADGGRAGAATGPTQGGVHGEAVTPHP